MSHKKIAAASVLAVAALAGCTTKAPVSEAPVQEAPAKETPVTVETAPKPAIADTGSVAVETPAAKTPQEISFTQPYEIGPGKFASLKGKMVLENGIVKSIEVPNAMGPQEAFAKGVGEKAYGKPVKGLQIETVSGASLTSAAFNAFLKTVN